jgi:N4-(beta-N-acetylglucosaminyl)-L-asparaginase
MRLISDNLPTEMKTSRREFIATTALAAVATTANAQVTKESDSKARKTLQAVKTPILICSTNGYSFLDAGFQHLRSGGDTLDSIMKVITGPENDPNDDSVGLGGLPNEECVVELDSCCMHGPTRRAGSVAGVHNIKNVSLLAKAVMEHTGHVMLVGEGAERFAYAHGFAKENLLTERSRKTWLLWKETMSRDDWWGPGLASPDYKFPGEMTSSEFREHRLRAMEKLAAELGIEPEFRMQAIRRVLNPPTGTINCSALNDKGEMSSATTTSGLSWKIPGRAGDSPIIGAGCYCDQDVGAAGATGNGEENIRVAGAHTIVENMRHGMTPVEAGLDALKRIARNYNNDMRKLRYLQMQYYVLRKDGAYAGVSLWSQNTEGARRVFALHDGSARKENMTALFEGRPVEWPPEPVSKA